MIDHELLNNDMVDTAFLCGYLLKAVFVPVDDKAFNFSGVGHLTPDICGRENADKV